MARYIDADVAISALKRWLKFPDYNKGEKNIIACAITMLEETPTADVVERKKGEWMPHPTNREYDVCSSCGIGVHRREYGRHPDGTEWVTEMSYGFCPWCGADMRKEVKK